METLIFLILAAIAVVSAANILIQRHPIYSALSLIVTFIALAGIYIQMRAEFIAVMQIVVYTGAIMVLFIFVIMLLNAREESAATPSVRLINYLGLPLSLLLVGQLCFVVFRAFAGYNLVPAAVSDNFAGNTAAIGKELYTRYVLPFEVTSILLLVAIIGAIVMAKKEI
ncbi:MAG: NADH-quinone oxidoreductase subunit J [Terriglobia bacterium]